MNMKMVSLNIVIIKRFFALQNITKQLGVQG